MPCPRAFQETWARGSPGTKLFRASKSSVPGRRPGQSPEQAELAAARAEIERLRATVTEQAVELHLHKGKSRWD